LSENKKGIIGSWRNCLKTKKLEKMQVAQLQKVDYKKFFIQKILTDKHLNPENYPLLCDYLQNKAVEIIDLEKPENAFQNLAIKLCKEEVGVSEFVKQVNALELSFGEFQNDLNGMIPKKVFGEYTISESDDACDLLLIGTEIEGSCQRVNGTPGLNKCLASYLMNGEIRPIVVKKGGKLIARSLMRLMWDEKNKTAVILQERYYSNVNDSSVENAINEWAKNKAKSMGIPLVSNEIGKGVPYVGTVEAKKGFAPFVYSDASGGILSGPFSIEGCHVLHLPDKQVVSTMIN
jgi:hypothetical protein